MPVIYIDILVALNLFIDFMLLSACSYILRLPRRRWRIVLGAAVGGISTCSILLPILPAPVTLLINIITSAVILRVAFAWSGWRGFGRQMAVFWILSAVFGGIALAIWTFLAPQGFTVIRGVVYYDVSPLMLTALTVLGYAVICIYDRITHKRTSRGQEWRLTVNCGAGEVTFRTLYDTGHHVADVFTGSPVAIVGRAAISPYLPDSLKELTENCDTADIGTEIAIKSRLRLIPCRTIAGDCLLPAFRPNHASITSGHNSPRDVTGMYIAVTDTLRRGEYEAIIGKDLVN